MSEVDGVKGVGSGAGDGEDNIVVEEQVASLCATSTKMVAPALRVEELRDDDGHSSGACVSEEEGALSHGEGHSDNERNITKSPMGEFQPPDEELKEKIIKQVEFYFSDANILKDAFLLKHVRRNKQGFVSLKLITSFKKVKSLTKDYRVVAYSLRQSEQLEVNEEGTKVRRKEALPDYDETTPSRTVVAVNLAQEAPTIESVAELFKQCGEIALIRVLRPGKPVPQDVKKHINRHPEIGTTVCAVIEFDDHEAAKKACELTDRDDWRKGMRVVLLASKKSKEKEKAKKKEGESPPESKEKEKDREEKSGDENKRDSDGGEKTEKKRRKRGGKRKNSRVDELISSENPNYSSDSGGESLEPIPMRNRSASAGAVTDTQGSNMKGSQKNSLSPKPDHNRLSPSSTPRTSPSASPRSSPRGSPNTGRRKYHGRSPLATELSAGESPRPSPHGSPESRRRSMNLEDKDTGSSPSSPWVQRRLKAQAAGQLPASSPGTSPRLGRRLPDGSLDKSPRMAHEERIIRQPRGPDGTKGFALERGKPRIET